MMDVTIANDETPLLSIQNVSKSYGSFQALDYTAFDLKRGEINLICGPSGAGKSTLVRCINMLEIADSGKVFFKGELAIIHLKRVGVAEQAKKCPAQLSGGQKQRVAIARDLTMTPDVILFDKPTSALDPEMIAEVLDVMTELGEGGQSMVCVSHEMGFAREVATEIIFMASGQIVECASPNIFFNNPSTDRAKEFLSHVI